MFNNSAQYYDIIYAARRKDYERESSLLQAFIERHTQIPVDTLLDVACGTGGHLEILQTFYKVAGLDLDPAMLEIAKGKLPGIPLYQGDMVDFDLGRKFDIVINLFSSIGYVCTVEKLAQTISNMARHTTAGGLVIVEPGIDPEKYEPGRLTAVFVDQPGLKIARMALVEVEDNLFIVNFHYLIAAAGEIRYFVENHKIGMFTQDEYLTAFSKAGLEVTYNPEGLMGRGLYIGQNLSENQG